MPVSGALKCGAKKRLHWQAEQLVVKGTLAFPFQHYERSVLIGQPPEGSQGYRPIIADYNEAVQSIAEAGKAAGVS